MRVRENDLEAETERGTNSQRERGASLLQPGALKGEPMIHGRREEEGGRKSDSPRNLFAATARNSGRKGRVTERGERDRGRRGEGD